MFDIIVCPIMSLALIWMGLNLFLGPRDYKAFARNLEGPSFARLFVRCPDWIIRGLGILLTLTGIYFFCRCNSQLAPKVERRCRICETESLKHLSDNRALEGRTHPTKHCRVIIADNHASRSRYTTRAL
jgi:hypothetical protein